MLYINCHCLVRIKHSNESIWEKYNVMEEIVTHLNYLVFHKIKGLNIILRIGLQYSPKYSLILTKYY